MPRRPRIHLDGVPLHIVQRSHNREPCFFADEQDQQAFLEVFGLALARMDAVALAFYLMGNHYHVVLQTRRADLSALMRQVNGVYTQRFNRRHGRMGHVFQGRFKAILVDREACLLELCRYVELNPVRAR